MPLVTDKSPITNPVPDSEKVIVIGIGEVPVGLDAEDVIETVGAVVSMIIALLAPRDPAAPGLARVQVALFNAASLIVPPLRAREVVPT